MAAVADLRQSVKRGMEMVIDAQAQDDVERPVQRAEIVDRQVLVNFDGRMQWLSGQQQPLTAGRILTDIVGGQDLSWPTCSFAVQGSINSKRRFIADMRNYTAPGGICHISSKPEA